MSELLTRPTGSTAATPTESLGKARVLVVDDERAILDALSVCLTADGHDVTLAGSIGEALRALEAHRFDVMMADVILCDGDGHDLLRAVRDRWPDMLVAMMSGYGTVESAVEAIKLGAFEYVSKPLRTDAIRKLVKQAVDQRSLLRAQRSLRRVLDGRFAADAVIGRTYQMQKVFDLVDAVADSKATVLMHGETGTGKSLVARLIHQRSQRRNHPFVEVSCGAIPETLLTSELFGHVRGAFTGAMADKDGKFRAAEGGTIFLDEISCASPSLQMKLLRVLQERQYEPLGSNRTLNADVRVILATNAELKREVEEGRFREDLYYRVNVVNIELPPLRQRLTDIALLAEHFLQKYGHQCGKRIDGFAEEALQCMQRYDWPGNVRELENCVERAVVLTRGDQIRLADLPPAIVNASTSQPSLFHRGAGRPLTLREALVEPERRIILAALEANQWNRQQTAEVLNINRTTLYKKIKRYGIEASARRGDGNGH